MIEDERDVVIPFFERFGRITFWFQNSSQFSTLGQLFHDVQTANQLTIHVKLQNWNELFTNIPLRDGLNETLLPVDKLASSSRFLNLAEFVHRWICRKNRTLRFHYSAERRPDGWILKQINRHMFWLMYCIGCAAGIFTTLGVAGRALNEKHNRWLIDEFLQGIIQVVTRCWAAAINWFNILIITDNRYSSCLQDLCFGILQ